MFEVPAEHRAFVAPRLGGGGDTIVTHNSPERPHLYALSDDGVSSSTDAAWMLTRRLSTRDQVHVMVRDAYGNLEQNSYPSRHRVGPLSPTTPWCVDLADDSGVFRLLCFDFDGKDKLGVNAELTERAHDDCDALSSALTEVDIAHVVCESSGTGGRHIWLALAGGAPADLVGQLARSARACYRTLDHGMLLNPAFGAARPPLSPHRDGSVSRVLSGSLDTLTEPSTTREQLSQLTHVLDERRPEPRLVDSAPSGPVDAAHSAHRALSVAGTAHMATIAGGSNPSWTGFMCLLAAAHAGWSLADVVHAAQTAPGMEHYRTKNTGRGSRRPLSAAAASERLEKQWAKAHEYAALHRSLPRQSEPADLGELQLIVADATTVLERFASAPGRWGRTEAATSQQTILTALTYLTLQTGKRVVAASIRDLGLMTALGRTTAADALLALAEAGFIRRVRGTTDGNAAEWQLLTGLSTGTGTVRSQPLNNPRPPSDLFATRADLLARIEEHLTARQHDLFTRKGLGHLAGKLYALLREHTFLNIDTAAQLLGVSKRYAMTTLSRLRHHRLLSKHPEGWARARRDLRNFAAKKLGVWGTLLERAERYRIEREIWAWWQVEVDGMHSAPRRRPPRKHVTARPLTFVEVVSGERVWPLYPRDNDGRGDHKRARYWAENGMLSPTSLWWSENAA